MNAAPVPPIVDGFDYVRLLGEGGQASVFQYQQQMPARPVAVKVLKDPLASTSARERFISEAHAMASLEHPFIVPVYWAGMTTDDRPYIVMQYYPRGTLADRVRREPMRLEEVLRIGIQVGSAVETAHQAGILHRDIKPQNILVNAFGAPGLSDFGIASRLGQEEDERSLSLPWAPPELFSGAVAPSPGADVYSLAATLWYLLTGVPPFSRRGTVRELMDAIRSIEPPPTGRPDVPASLEAVLKAAMSKDAAQRPQSAYDFVRQLQNVERDLYFIPTEPAFARKGLEEGPETSGSGAATMLAPEPTDLRAPVRPDGATPASAPVPLAEPEPRPAPASRAESASGPAPQPDRASGPAPQADRASGPAPQPEPVPAPVPGLQLKPVPAPIPGPSASAPLGRSLAEQPTILAARLCDAAAPQPSPTLPARTGAPKPGGPRTRWAVLAVTLVAASVLVAAVSLRGVPWLSPLPGGSSVSPSASATIASHSRFAANVCLDQAASLVASKPPNVVDCAGSAARSRLEASADGATCATYRSPATLDGRFYCAFPLVRTGDCIPAWINGASTMYPGLVRPCSEPLPLTPERPASAGATATFGYRTVLQVTALSDAPPTCGEGELGTTVKELGIDLCVSGQ